MKYKIGDRVRIINNDGVANLAKINDIAFIKEIDESKVPYCCRIIGKGVKVWLCEEDITKEDYTWEDFLQCPIGTKITFENNDILVKNNDIENEFENRHYYRDYEDLDGFKDYSLGQIIKIEEPTYTTVYEPTEQVEEMTLEEICKELGRNIKIVKEKE